MAGIAPGYYLRITPHGEYYACEGCDLPRPVGGWPFCGSGHKMPGAFGFDPFTPYIDPHILPPEDPRARNEGSHPVLGKIRGTLIESREQRRKLMKEQGLDWAGRSHESGGMEV